MKVQAYNQKIKAWVKGDLKTNKKTGGKFVAFNNVKQKEPMKPFKGVKKI